jgi:hypothetical protein
MAVVALEACGYAYLDNGGAASLFSSTRNERLATNTLMESRDQPDPTLTSTVARLNENVLESMDHTLYEEQFQVVPEVCERSRVCFASGCLLRTTT